MVGTRDIRRSEWLLAVALSLLAAGGLVYGVAVGVRMPAGIAALILALLSLLIASRSLGACRARLRAGGRLSYAVAGHISEISEDVHTSAGTSRQRGTSRTR